MRTLRSSLLLAVVAPALSITLSCGYFVAGQWEDDPKNWHRVFGTEKPPGVVIIHSYVWRSPHWTWEGGYFFEFQKNADFEARLFKNNNFKPDASRARYGFDFVPWFTPKALEAYDVWRYADHPGSSFRLFIDRETGNMFLMEYQL